jgi:DNA recombination protein RmuC
MAALFLILGLVAGAGVVYVWARGQIALERRAADEKLALVREAQSGWEDRVKAVTGEALTKSQTSLLELTEARLAPIKETLTKFEAQSRQLEDKRTREVSAIGERLREVVDGQEKLRTETGSLVTALRAPHVRGRWGEIQLKRVVELAGMLEHCDFLEQQWGEGEDGRSRPDLVVRLPGGRQIVVDSKAPLTAYLDAHDATDDDARVAHLKRHAQLVRSHMTALGRKAYWETFSPSPELVVMFLPGEMLYSAALQTDGELLEAGANQKVLLAGPTMLIGLLRAIALGWREEALALNAQEVAELGKQLYERLGKLAGHWTDVGAKLGKAVDAYNASVGTLESRVLVTARKFQELKAAPEGEEIEAPAPVDVLPRVVTAPELVDATSPPVALPEILGTTPRPVAAPELVPSLPVAALERFARTG